MTKRILQPSSWPRAKGYSWGIAASGQFVCIAGMVGTNKEGAFLSTELVPQFEQALNNGLVVLQEAGGQPHDIVRMNWFLRDKAAYIKSSTAIGEVYRRLMGSHYPAMTVVEVSALMDDEAQVEIEITAVVPQI
jgi:enamine deaminase RidA (YjgF/YER057c/UK114 family)